LRSVCSKAFQTWAKVSKFTFQEATAGASADIVIEFYSGDHGDRYPFDGPGKTLAHAFYPQDGRLHYDADENWSTDPAMDQTDLESVTVHEIGHLLGLHHSTDHPEAIMYPTIEAGKKKRDLAQDDIDGIHALYSN
jgi:predicted Zn-dependent protease